MGPFGVVEDQPLGEFWVEAGEVGEEQVFVVVDEGFLDGAIEAFGMGIHFWGLGVGIPTGDLLFREGLGEARLKLGAVVGEQHLGLLREQIQFGGEGSLGVACGFAG